MTRTVPASLAHTRHLVAPALRAAAERLSPEIRTVVAYHLGWIEADGTPGGHEGKGVRPTLALLSARAAGRPAEAGVNGAVAVELVHNFSLLHDDIMDRDGERHHRATAWTVFGEPRAILAGDALLTLAVQVLLAGSEPERVQAAALLADATQRMIEGQSRDLALEGRLDATLDETIEMISHKTAALLSCSSAIGAVLAGGGPELVEPLARFGEHVGVSFQAVDDVLGIWGEPSVTGKPAWSDLRQQKRSYPVAVALAADHSGRLRDLLARARLSEADLAGAAELIEQGGGREQALEEADRRLELALAELDTAPMPADVRDELAELARFVTEREF